jgi:hypothetical protein
MESFDDIWLNEIKGKKVKKIPTYTFSVSIHSEINEHFDEDSWSM